MSPPGQESLKLAESDLEFLREYCHCPPLFRYLYFGQEIHRSVGVWRRTCASEGKTGVMGPPSRSRVALICIIATLAVDAFDKPFIPTNSTPYDPMKSSTFQRTKGRFALSYADQTHLNGYVGQDIVQVRAPARLRSPPPTLFTYRPRAVATLVHTMLYVSARLDRTAARHGAFLLRA